MDDILNELQQAILRCEDAVQMFKSESLEELHARVLDAISSAAEAWSGSWFGYQSAVYIAGLAPKQPGERFSIEYGLSGDNWDGTGTRGRWIEYARQDVIDAILKRADAQETPELTQATSNGKDTFEAVQREVLPTLAALLGQHADANIQERYAEIGALRSNITADAYLRHQRPTGQFLIRDGRAREGGVQSPPHLGGFRLGVFNTT